MAILLIVGPLPLVDIPVGINHPPVAFPDAVDKVSDVQPGILPPLRALSVSLSTLEAPDVFEPLERILSSECQLSESVGLIPLAQGFDESGGVGGGRGGDGVAVGEGAAVTGSILQGFCLTVLINDFWCC